MLYEKEKLKRHLQMSDIESLEDGALINSAGEKIKDILSRSADDIDAKNDIETFAKRDETSMRKLFLYCLDFCDPSTKFVVKEVVQQHFLSETEFEKLHRFVRKHKDDKTFGEAVYEVMAKHNMSAPEVYKNAKLSRQDFSRVTSMTSSGVRKSTVWSIIVGLHCNLDEADYLLFSAGYIRRKTKTDLILEFFITNQQYDILAINDALNEYGQKALALSIPVKNKDILDN